MMADGITQVIKVPLSSGYFHQFSVASQNLAGYYSQPSTWTAAHMAASM